jgi:hypothetical protein
MSLRDNGAPALRAGQGRMRKGCQTEANKLLMRPRLPAADDQIPWDYKGGSGGRDRTGDLRIMIPPL